MCGEQILPLLAPHGNRGSPPRVRGTVSPKPPGIYRQGITPACAGNRPGTPCGGRGSGDHPRVCGEQQVKDKDGGLGRGSPPRVRGTATAKVWPADTLRITPACAGNSLAAHNLAHCKKDHPRVCGEQNRSQAALTAEFGSPPRVRGTGFKNTE